MQRWDLDLRVTKEQNRLADVTTDRMQASTNITHWQNKIEKDTKSHEAALEELENDRNNLDVHRPADPF